MNGDRTDNPDFLAFAKQFREDENFHKACIDVERAFHFYSKNENFKYFLKNEMGIKQDTAS